MTTYREYPCSSDVKGDRLHVWYDGDGVEAESGFRRFGFQTTGGPAFLSGAQIQNLVNVLTGEDKIGNGKSAPPPWRDVTD